MHYNVIVSADIRQKHANPASFDAPAGIKSLLQELLSSNTRMTSEGILRSRKSGRIELIYRGEDDREMTVSFMKSDPSLIALTHGETLFENAVTLYLEEGKRHRSVAYDMRGEKFETTVLADKVDNRLLKSGKLTLSFKVYICGVCAEETQMDISIVHDTSDIYSTLLFN